MRKFLRAADGSGRRQPDPRPGTREHALVLAGLTPSAGNGPTRFLQARRDLAERAMFDGADEFREHVAAVLHDLAPTRPARVRCRRRGVSRNRAAGSSCRCFASSGVRIMLTSGQRLLGIVVAVQPDDGPGAVVNLAFHLVRARLNLAALVTPLHRRLHAALPVDLAELFQDRRFHRVADGLHAGRTRQRVHHVAEQAAFLQQDRLRVRGRAGRIPRWAW